MPATIKIGARATAETRRLSRALSGC